MHIRRFLLTVLTALLTLSGSALAREGQQAPAPSHAFLDMMGKVTPVGDIEMALSMRPAPERWKLLKTRYNSPAMLFRDLLAHNSAMETEFPSPVTFDERALRINTTMVLRGYARNEGNGEWFCDLDLDAGQTIKGHEVSDADGVKTLRWVITQQGDGVVFEINMVVALPKAASNLRVNASEATFRYTLKHPDGEGSPRLDSRMRLKPRILTGAYKVYAMKDQRPEQWLAKVIMKNTGSSVARRVRVRFRIPGYSDWGLWTKIAELVPGQTAVIPYHPVLDAKVAQLQSKTPINVMYEWRYEDKDGQRHEDTDGERATMLGGHEFFFTNYSAGEYDASNFYEVMTENSDLLAAWVSREDAVVDEFAAMANRIAGGAASHKSHELTITTLHGIYELWLRNSFVYLSPPGLVDQSVSFDPKLLQNIKHPRDVIRDKAGTCIDLAILYAAMAASQGIEPYLALVPSHCFPVFKLPKERGQKGPVWFAVEATGITGGMGKGARTWPQVVQAGRAQLQKVFAGTMPGTLVPVKQLWEKGITGPELPPLPADIIKRWGLSEGGSGSAPAPQPGPQPQPSTGVGGTWMGTQVYRFPNGTLTAQLKIQIGQRKDGRPGFEGVAVADVPQDTGGTVRLVSAAEGTVSMQGNQITFNILASQTKNMATGDISQDGTDTVILTVNGNTMSGTKTNADGVPVTYHLTKQP